MREPPPEVGDSAVLDAVRQHWAVDVDRAEHLPVGFGAHHWRVSVAGVPRFFVTLDPLAERHTPDTLERAYASAAALAGAGLEFVVPGVPTESGHFTVPFGSGRLSAVRWLDGTAAGTGSIGSVESATATVAMLQRLHAASPPPLLRRWRPLVHDRFPADVATLTTARWDTGPYGSHARTGLRERLAELRRWTARYLRLADLAARHVWVVTHGEPHTANQMITRLGVVLVDWESVMLAPRERDLRPLVEYGWADRVAPRWDMIEMFDLEWRLDEICQYAAWFSAPHAGSESDLVAFDGLMHELERPDWRPPPQLGAGPT